MVTKIWLHKLRATTVETANDMVITSRLACSVRGSVHVIIPHTNNLRTFPARLDIFTIAPWLHFLSVIHFANACPMRNVPCKQTSMQIGRPIDAVTYES